MFLDAAEISSIEEIRTDGEAPCSYVTQRNGCGFTVIETPEAIGDLMTAAMNPKVSYEVSVNGPVGQDLVAQLAHARDADMKAHFEAPQRAPQWP